VLGAAIVVAAYVLVAVSLSGCASRPLDSDVFPAGYETRCNDARNRAIVWYRGKWRTEPAVPYTRVTLAAKPMNNMGAWTTGYNFHIWEGQRPFDASLEHEFRHVLNNRNRKGDSEEATR
jgi:acyl-coenzyme A synthetase/AMP-(fatty) acid ligase